MVEVFVCHVEKEVLWEVAKSLDKGKDSDSRKQLSFRHCASQERNKKRRVSSCTETRDEG